MAPLRARRPDLLLALAAAGAAIAGYLGWVALDAGQEAACGGVGNCGAVQGSRYAEIGGVPIALLGFGMYAALLALLAARRLWPRLRGGEAPPRALASLPFALAFGGTLYSAYLTYLELFVIEAICPWCVASAVVVTLIALLAAPDLRAAGPPPAAAGIIGASGSRTEARGRQR